MSSHEIARDMNNDKVNILIVDDLPDKLLAFRSILDELQQNLVVAHSGREALQKLLEYDFAVILLDVNMPDMDGLETAKLIRQYRRTRQTPIVFITAYMDDIQSLRGYALGAVDYIPVPVVPEILRSKIKVFVDLYRMHNQLRQQAEEREALARAEAARDASELARRRADLLADASHILTRSLDIDAIVNGLLLFSLTNFADRALVMMFGESRQLTRAIFAWDRSETSDRDASIDLALDTLPSELLQAIETIDIQDDLIDLADAGSVYLQPDKANLTPEKFQGVQSVSLGAVKLMPLFSRRNLIGALVLDRAGAVEFFDGDDSLLKEIASRSAIAIENALLYSAIRADDRHKNEFLAMLSHELRNPLAPIRNAVHILRMLPDSIEKVQWASEVISRQVEHMTHIMNDLLDMSRIARGVVEIEQQRIGLNDVISRSLETCRPLLDTSGHQLEVRMPDEEIELHGDIVRLSQIFSNLIHNAIKYSPEGSHIRLSAVYGDEEIAISVCDNGHGIGPELLPHIFDLFVQGDNSIERKQGGLGVGLTLVKHLLELHHGRIEASSEGIGKGAEFIVRLPARCISQPISSAPAALQRVRSHTGRVLVVDDLEASAESMKLLLEMQGYKSTAVHDGPAALEAVADFKPDVVLLDIGLPGMDGYEVSRQLHRAMGNAAPFIIALTGYGQESDRAEAVAAGIHAHVVKPANIDELLAKIAAFCATRNKCRDNSEVA